MENDGISRLYIKSPNNAYVPFRVWEMYPKQARHTQFLKGTEAQAVLDRCDVSVIRVVEASRDERGITTTEQLEIYPTEHESFTIPKEHSLEDYQPHLETVNLIVQRLGRTGLTIVRDADTEYRKAWQLQLTLF